jgi:lambda family phage portal protein
MWPITPSKKQLLKTQLAEQQRQIDEFHARAENNRRARAKRAFQGAVIDRLTADWVAMGTSQDAEIRASLPRLRNRSRQLGRDNDYVKQFYRSVQNNVIGEDGIKFEAQVRMLRGKSGKGPSLDESINSSIEDAWSEWCRAENCHTAGKLHFVDIEHLVARSIFESGEVILRFIYQPMGNMKIPMAIEVLESDMLDDNYNAVSPEGNPIRMGVEVNKWGRPVAYWFFHKHPGDYGVMPNMQTEPGKRIRVPAEEVVHLFFIDRWPQTRGIPAIASAIMRLRHMQGYEEAEVVGARAAAAIMGFIQSPEMDPSMKDDVDDGDSVTEFEPGVFKKLGPGESVNVPSVSRPGGQFDPFMRMMLRGVAAGAGASYETISRDYSQSTYSSTRQALIEDRDNWRKIQKWMIRNFHQKVFERWLDMTVLSGTLSLKNYELNPAPYRNVKWMPRGWSWVDPLKEVQAYKEAVRAGFMTQSDVISLSGGDFEDLIVQRQREVDLAAEKNLVFDTDPSKVNALGVQQPSEDANMATDSEAEPPEPDNS